MRRSIPRGAVSSAAVLGCLLLVLAGVLWFVHYQDNRRSVQTVSRLPAPPTAHRLHGYCDPPIWSPSVADGGGGLVTADPHPTGAVVYWLPGSNASRCHVVVAKLTEAQASSLATDVRNSVVRKGTYACPNDDGSAAWIFFRYAGRSDFEVVDAQLTGCTFASAPHRGSVGPAWRGTVELDALRPAGT